MAAITSEQTVGELVAEKPGRARIFEKLGIDYCCGGKKSLEQACRDQGLDVNTALKMLDATEEIDADAAERDWTRASLTELADHIEQTHHVYLRDELPRLGQMVRKVAAVHHANHPWLLELDTLFAGFAAEMEAHLLQEEQILFPIVRAMEQPEADQDMAGASLSGPVESNAHEHESAGQALARMRQLSSDFTPPADACATFQAMLDGLHQLEKDTHQHVHKENNILFARALEMEKQQSV